MTKIETLRVFEADRDETEGFSRTTNAFVNLNTLSGYSDV